MATSVREDMITDGPFIDAHRREWARMLAATARAAGDLDLAEECVQEAHA